MTPIEYLTVGISALAIVTRIVMFIRNPSVTTPTELWIANTRSSRNSADPRQVCRESATRPAFAGRCHF
jgi:hypothetical protein